MNFNHKELIENLISWITEKKGEDIAYFDVHEKSDYTDSIIICTGTVELHTQAIAEYLIEKAKEHNIQILSKEGIQNGNWILLDFVEVIIHIFTEETRKYYQLEDLWNVKKIKDVENNHVERKDQ